MVQERTEALSSRMVQERTDTLPTKMIQDIMLIKRTPSVIHDAC